MAETNMKYRAVFGLLLTSVIPAGSQQAPTFEVASIRFGDPQPQSASLRFLPNGEMVARNFPLDLILQEVYEVRQFQIAGLERWTSRWSTTRLTIRAKASGATSEAELKRMAQGLLSERFRLRLHREMRELPVYALVPAKGGIKLQVTEQDGRPRGIGGINGSVPMGRLSGNNVSMPHFVQILSEQQLDRPVVDKTGFTEAFDFKLEYATIDRADAVGPSIFTALQEQLGLRLEPVRAAVEILVIDHIEKPSEN